MDQDTTITVDEEITLVTMHNIPINMEFISNVFANISDMGINIDMISISPSKGVLTSLSFTVQDNDFVKVLEYVSEIRKKSPEVTSSVSNGNCKITVFDSRMEHSPGFAAKVFKSVAESKADIRIITTSIDEISLLTTRDDFENTIKKISSVGC